MDPVIIAAIIGSLIGGFFSVMVSSIALILYFEARKEKKILELIKKQRDEEEMLYHNEVKDTLHDESCRLDSRLSGLEKNVMSLTLNIEKLNKGCQQMKDARSWWQFWN